KRSLYCSSETARPEAAGSSSKHTRCQGKAAAACTSPQLAIDWARVLSQAWSRFPARSPTNYPPKLAHLIGTLEQTLDVGGVRGRSVMLAGQRMPVVTSERIERPGHQMHQPVGGQHAHERSDAEEVDLLANGRLDVQADVALVHADMHVAGVAGEDASRDLRVVSEAGECALVDVLRILVVGEDFVGNVRHESMCDDHAMLVHDEDVGDAGDLDELVDDGLEGRVVLVDDQVHVRVGNAARNRPTIVQEIASQLSVDGVDVEAGGQRHNQPYYGEQAEQGFLIESGDPHRFPHVCHSPSPNGTNRPSLTPV